MNIIKQNKILDLFVANEYACTLEGDVISYKHGYPRILKPTITSAGYRMVTFLMRGKSLWIPVHQLVVLYFNGNYEPHLQVNHIDGNKLNNHKRNLELVTGSEQIKHAYRLGLLNQQGEKNNRSKLTWKKVRKIRFLLSKGMSARKLAKKFKVSTSNISQIKINVTWREDGRAYSRI